MDIDVGPQATLGGPRVLKEPLLQLGKSQVDYTHFLLGLGTQLQLWVRCRESFLRFLDQLGSVFKLRFEGDSMAGLWRLKTEIRQFRSLSLRENTSSVRRGTFN